MRFRVGVVPPASLTVFDGRRLVTEAAWCAKFDAWCAARDAWAAQHPGADLPEGRVLGECPFEDEFPHAGWWERSVPDDGLGVRCREHGLRPDEH